MRISPFLARPKKDSAKWRITTNRRRGESGGTPKGKVGKEAPWARTHVYTKQRTGEITSTCLASQQKIDILRPILQPSVADATMRISRPNCAQVIRRCIDSFYPDLNNMPAG